MTKPYDFVPFLKCEPYEQEGSLEGIIPITIEVLTPVHIHRGGTILRTTELLQGICKSK